MAGKKNTAPSGLEGILSQQNWEGRTEPKGLGRVDRAQMMGGGTQRTWGSTQNAGVGGHRAHMNEGKSVPDPKNP